MQILYRHNFEHNRFLYICWHNLAIFHPVVYARDQWLPSKVLVNPLQLRVCYVLLVVPVSAAMMTGQEASESSSRTSAKPMSLLS